MNITNDASSLDAGKFLDYIKKNLSSDVAQLVAAKDELAKRQGALSAVEDAIKTKADADKYAATKKASADELLDKAAGKKQRQRSSSAKVSGQQNGQQQLNEHYKQLVLRISGLTIVIILLTILVQ